MDFHAILGALSVFGLAAGGFMKFSFISTKHFFLGTAAGLALFPAAAAPIAAFAASGPPPQPTPEWEGKARVLMQESMETPSEVKIKFTKAVPISLEVKTREWAGFKATATATAQKAGSPTVPFVCFMSTKGSFQAKKLFEDYVVAPPAKDVLTLMSPDLIQAEYGAHYHASLTARGKARLEILKPTTFKAGVANGVPKTKIACGAGRMAKDGEM